MARRLCANGDVSEMELRHLLLSKGVSRNRLSQMSFNEICREIDLTKEIGGDGMLNMYLNVEDSLGNHYTIMDKIFTVKTGDNEGIWYSEYDYENPERSGINGLEWYIKQSMSQFFNYDPLRTMRKYTKNYKPDRYIDAVPGLYCDNQRDRRGNLFGSLSSVFFLNYGQNVTKCFSCDEVKKIVTDYENTKQSGSDYVPGSRYEYSPKEISEMKSFLLNCRRKQDFKEEYTEDIDMLIEAFEREIEDSVPT